jgi:hypothetical protein
MSGVSGTTSALWVDKHRPVSLRQLNIHDDVTIKLRALAAVEDLPHLLMHGPGMWYIIAYLFPKLTDRYCLLKLDAVRRPV